ncbi:outer membrane transport energization protein TonB [Chitinophaga skermanii]|uniref:Outer membrane transport energization protein TonB n=1 Tax=Chitinophaga skermanii TaxID=331697 RepID=A0A327R2K0_9BACT|nr:energy transducer TonB [Chitinophaga skermanii]RAJ10851.1 outer membrane transport energization protein TonB [Chitinophaga skermanii]
MDSAKILKSDFLDILFDGRNKEYGAYDLRKQYNKRVRNSIIATASLAVLIIGGYVISKSLKANEDTTKSKPVIEDIKLEDVKMPDDPKTPPPPPPPPAPPPPVKPTVQFTPPVIKKDNEVPPEEEPPKIEEIKDKAVSTKTVEGDPNGIDPGLLSDSKGTGVVEAPPPPPKEEIFTFVENPPTFPGGEDALNKFLQKNVRYPHMASENGISGTVFVTFVVDSEGKIKDVKTVGAAKGGGLEEEAVRVVRSMPNWKPGKQNGRSVSVQFNLPIRFTLQE